MANIVTPNDAPSTFSLAAFCRGPIELICEGGGLSMRAELWGYEQRVWREGSARLVMKRRWDGGGGAGIGSQSYLRYKI